jgi:threonine aldolase
MNQGSSFQERSPAINSDADQHRKDGSKPGEDQAVKGGTPPGAITPRMIDLRSDTATQPTQAMRAAIAAAEVGDEQRGEDPTVLELEHRAAAFLGQAAAVYVPTATMANQIAVRILTEPGDELLAEENAHVLVNEQGAPAALSGLVMRGLHGENGRFTPAQIESSVRDWRSGHMPRTRLVCIENTHNSSGGRVWPMNELEILTAACRELDLRVHLDGARIVNASTALGVEPAAIGRHFDTVTLCLSKGLGCPLGAIVAGSEELMVKARRVKHLFGGAMRQAGIVAAAGIYALDHHVHRTEEDHARARRLAEGLAGAGLPIDLAQVETNFVLLDVAHVSLSTAAALSRLQGVGVLLSGTVYPSTLRAVTHLGIDDAATDRAVELIPAALSEAAT